MENSFDNRINPRAEIKDLKYPLIKNYLLNINSSLLKKIDNLDTRQLARELKIADGPEECYKPLNVGLLFFNDHPENFFPYSQIEVVNIPGPDRSISDKDIQRYQMRTRRYRNRRIGDFLKELHLVEGRNTGIPTAIRAIKANGSPLPTFLTDEERSFFSVIMPIHPAFTKKETSF